LLFTNVPVNAFISSPILTGVVSGYCLYNITLFSELVKYFFYFFLTVAMWTGWSGVVPMTVPDTHGSPSGSMPVHWCPNLLPKATMIVTRTPVARRPDPVEAGYSNASRGVMG